MLYPGWRSFFSSLFCHALFQSRNFCGTFFISAIDFCLQDSSNHNNYRKKRKKTRPVTLFAKVQAMSHLILFIIV